MPLNVFINDKAAHKVFSKTRDINGVYIGDVGMGGYYTVNNTQKPTALGTCGAGPCQIIVVHKSKGLGALGHYGGDDRPEKVVEGVRKMVARLGGFPVEAIVLAAGVVGEGNAQEAYESGLIEGIRALYPQVQVSWPKGGEWGAAYYLPLAEELGLLEDSPGDFTGTGKPQDGICGYGFDM